jgi:hypothetical protein
MATVSQELGTPDDMNVSPLGRWAARFAQAVGLRVLHQLIVFSRNATPGSMITIKCTREGFTAQVTGSIVGGRSAPISQAEMRDLMEDIEWE